MDNPHYVTPEEAENKRCVEAPDVWYCHGPECMAWRWQTYMNEMRDPHTGNLMWPGKYSTTHGYCGMVRI